MPTPKIFSKEMSDIVRRHYPKHGAHKCLKLIQAKFHKNLTCDQVVNHASHINVRMTPEARLAKQKKLLRGNTYAFKPQKENDKEETEEELIDPHHKLWLSSISISAWCCVPWTKNIRPNPSKSLEVLHYGDKSKRRMAKIFYFSGV